MSVPPSGFQSLEIPFGYAAEFGPIYAKREGEGVALGFRLDERHVNFRDVPHGGALATFADMQFAGVQRMGLLERKASPTIRLSIDYLAPAALGDWIEAEVELVKRTRRLAFTQAVMRVGDVAIARTHGLYSYVESAPAFESAMAPPPAPEFEPAPPPEGWTAFDAGPGYGQKFGPIYRAEDEPRLGFRVAAHHINLFGACHGGALATFADYQIGPFRRMGRVTPRFCPTLSLAVDYLAPARLGDWVEADVSLARETKGFVFTHALISNAAGPVARSTAIYAVPRAE